MKHFMKHPIVWGYPGYPGTEFCPRLKMESALGPHGHQVEWLAKRPEERQELRWRCGRRHRNGCRDVTWNYHTHATYIPNNNVFSYIYIYIIIIIITIIIVIIMLCIYIFFPKTKSVSWLSFQMPFLYVFKMQTPGCRLTVRSGDRVRRCDKTWIKLGSVKLGISWMVGKKHVQKYGQS